MNSAKVPTLSLPASFDGVFFTTLRLHDALPENFGQNLGIQYYSKQVEYAKNPDRLDQLHLVRKRLFARFDQALDLEKYGHAYLRAPALAQIVADEICRSDDRNYTLLAYAILPNHVHLLFDLRTRFTEDEPLDELQMNRFQPLREMLERIQNATEAPLKKTLRRLGGHLDSNIFQKRLSNGAVKMEGKCWHEQSFDFRVRDATEFEKVTQYILQNPIKAALVKDFEAWPFLYRKA
ncbi:MAG: transposase [Saprospiraceae bacterium]